MSDLISRQAAIDAINCNIVITGKRNAEEVASTIGAFVDRIKALPSAEPNPFCALADRSCPFQGKEFVWCLTCPHISEEDRELVKKAVEGSQPKTGRLTDDDFEAIRIHLNAQKERLCNQQRWEEADEYQRIIDRFTAFASAVPKTGGNTNANEIYNYLKERIGGTVDDMKEFDAWFERMVWHVKECNRLVDRPQEWIPCSERLPELTPANELQHYIVTIKKECGLRDEVYDAFYLGNGWQIGDMIMLEKNDVLAWMPLPKPYREDEA